ncbi:MAG: hypothetical protein JF886_02360 [Candidatus Dormibacteraeota bacterium]|uniref:Uncharacterized protein n=1 Tax=Candidatus Aeolococcus gillhamiae TaxID=3127015 RepID=A0A934JYL1_9BACT|nr:hypothetical protein [Candidatus Dormibacteraeota bacterium]
MVAVLFAWPAAGVRLVSAGTTGAAVLMALLTAVALLCYALMVFTMTFGNPE